MLTTFLATTNVVLGNTIEERIILMIHTIISCIYPPIRFNIVQFIVAYHCTFDNNNPGS